MLNGMPTGRKSFRDHIPEIAFAATLLDRAAGEHLAGNETGARELIRAADIPVLRDWLDSIWGRASPYILMRTVPGGPGVSRVRSKQRMPTLNQKRELIARDGHHCRLCGMPVIRAEVRRYLRGTYANVLPWGATNATQHAGFQLLWLQYDHLLPYARGGTNDPDNMFIACAACNFGRMNWTLAEVGFASLEDIEPITSGWDGLERVLPEARRSKRVV